MSRREREGRQPLAREALHHLCLHEVVRATRCACSNREGRTRFRITMPPFGRFNKYFLIVRASYTDRRHDGNRYAHLLLYASARARSPEKRGSAAGARERVLDRRRRTPTPAPHKPGVGAGPERGLHVCRARGRIQAATTQEDRAAAAVVSAVREAVGRVWGDWGVKLHVLMYPPVGVSGPISVELYMYVGATASVARQDYNTHTPSFRVGELVHSACVRPDPGARQHEWHATHHPKLLPAARATSAQRELGRQGGVTVQQSCSIYLRPAPAGWREAFPNHSA